MQNPDPDAVVERVLTFARSRQLFHPGQVVVAVSGGQDSLCMLDILFRIRDELRIELAVVHLDHMFRGAESAAEAEFVRGLAERMGLPVEVAAIDVSAYRARHHLTEEVAARYARYRFLIRAAERWAADQIAVGHTADDAAETLLLNLLRGSGLAGLGGMRPSRQIAPGQLGPELLTLDWRTPELPASGPALPRVVRPILGLSRAETAAYCVSLSLPFRTDPSNLNTTYRRNWIRGQLMPMLEKHAPGVRERLSSTSELLADDYDIVGGILDRTWSDLAIVREKRVEFELATWGTLEEPLQRHLLRKAVHVLVGSLEGLGRVHVDVALEVIRQARVGARADLPMGIYLEKGYNSFWLAGRADDSVLGLKMPELPVRLLVPGETVLPVGGIEAGLVEPPAEAALEAYRSAGRQEAYLDADKTGPALEVRRRRSGDRFYPLGMGNPKKLHDFLVDEKVPRSARDGVPVVATPDAVVWVAGYRIDERFKVTADTKRVLHLRIQGAGDGDQGTEKSQTG